jgi:hypothetical protein
MRLRIVSFFVLIIFRVFLVPVWYAWHVPEVKDAVGTFDHIRLKKRRSSYLEENPLSIEVCFSRAAVNSQVQRLLPFYPEIAATPPSCAEENGLSYLISRDPVLPLYLRNRTLRI